MASKALKGLTVKIGGDTSELTKALDKVDKQSRNLSSELGQINKLLKLDPKNTELLAQKQKVLADAISNTEDKLDALKEAEKQVQAQFARGEVSEEQYRALQREIIATEKKLDGYKKAAKETDDTVEELGDNSHKLGKFFKELAEKSEDANESISKLDKGLSKGLAVGLAAVAAAATAAIAGIKNVVEETAEYRREMAKLDTAFEKSGHSSEVAYETYAELQSVLGETDQAVEAANFLAKLADNEEDLAKWTEICTGVYGEFGASLPIEGLAEAANETAKVGQVTGPLADALNWAAKEGETFGVKMKEATEANEDWNKAVEEATSAEDYFNLALQECSTEQERQTLIMETLNGMYSDSAKNFRENNEEVIKQNKASEKLQKVWAKIGKKVAPIVTTFTEGIADLAEAFLELIEDVDIESFTSAIKSGFQKIIDNVLPKLIKALEWCVENFDLLKSVAIGFLAALAVTKLASFATMITSTLVPALAAGTKGQMAMNAAAYSNPYVLLAAAIVAVVAAVVSLYGSHLDKLTDKSYEATKAIHGLTEAEIEAADRAVEAGEAFRQQRESMDENISSIQSQFSYLGSLRGELDKLADASGRVQEKDQARVNFILGQLNEALGTEYKMVDGVIQKYGELTQSIDEVMLKKKAELLLEAGGEAYVEAIRNKQQAEADYYTNLAAYKEAQIQMDRLKAEGEALNAEKAKAWTAWQMDAVNKKIAAHNGEYKAVEEALKKSQEAYENNRQALEGYYSDIGQYETAQRLMLEGNTAEAEKIMSDRAYYVAEYADKVGFESDQIQNTWELEATTAGVVANTVRDNWIQGMEGYAAPMVSEAQNSYGDAIKAMEGAYDDAYGIGGDMGQGIADGAENKRSVLRQKAQSMADSFFNAFKAASQIKSPSKRAIKLTEYIGEGAAIGIENTTEDVVDAAEDQAAQVFAAYEGIQDLGSQQSLRNLEKLEASNRSVAQASMASAANPVLEKILAAIERGQILTIDGKALVGATAGNMDNTLGQRRALAARGAL